MVDFKGLTANIGASVDGIVNWLGVNLISFFIILIVGAVMFWVYWRFVHNNVRVRVIKPNGVQHVAIAREFHDKKTGQLRFSISGYKLHDGSPPPQKAYYIFRGSMKLYRGCTAYQDNNGFLHFVDTIKVGEGEERINIIDPVTIEQYFESRERAFRKYVQKDEKMVAYMLTSLVIYTLILTAGIGWSMYQYREASEQQNQGMQAVGAAIQKLDVVITTNQAVAGSNGFQESETIDNSLNPLNPLGG